jgi:hypothetical protein
MKTLLKLALMLALAAGARASTIETLSIFVTNTAAHSNSIVFDTNDPRYASTNITNSATQWAVTNSAGWTATNLYLHLLAHKPHELAAYSVQWSPTNAHTIHIVGPINTNLSAQTFSGWASLGKGTNTYGGNTNVTVPRIAYSSTAQSNIVSALVDWLNQPSRSGETVLGSAPLFKNTFLAANNVAQSATNKSFRAATLDAAVINSASLDNVTWGNLVYQTTADSFTWTLGDPFIPEPTLLISGDGLGNEAGITFNPYGTSATTNNGAFYNQLGGFYSTNGGQIGTATFDATGMTLGGDVTLSGSFSAGASVFTGIVTNQYGLRIFNGSSDYAPLYYDTALGRLQLGYDLNGSTPRPIQWHIAYGHELSLTQFTTISATISTGYVTRITSELGLNTTFQTNAGATLFKGASVTSLAAGNNVIARPTNNLVMYTAAAGIPYINNIATNFGNGDWFWAMNNTGYPLTVWNQSGFDPNTWTRISLDNAVTNIVINPGGSMLFVFDSSAGNWRLAYPRVEIAAATNLVFGTFTLTNTPIAYTNIDFTNIWAHGEQQAAVYVAGVKTNDFPSVDAPFNAISNALTFCAAVISNNYVNVRAINGHTNSVDLPAANYRVKVEQYQ